MNNYFLKFQMTKSEIQTNVKCQISKIFINKDSNMLVLDAFS